MKTNHSNKVYLTAILRCLVVALCCLVQGVANAQSAKHLALADAYFNSGEYFTAAGLYEQYLHPVKRTNTASDFPLNFKKNRTAAVQDYASRSDIIFRQAESYRLANEWTRSMLLYKACYDKDPEKYALGLYWIAVGDRALGNYVSAEENLGRYLKLHGSANFSRQAALEERATLDFIKSQMSRPDSVLFSIAKNETDLSKSQGVFAPARSADDTWIITTAIMDTVTEEGLDPHHNRLFYASFSNGSVNNLQALLLPGTDLSAHQGAAAVSADGRHLYYTQWKKQEGKIISSIWYATKTNSAWNKPVMLQSIGQGHNNKQPFCTPDGKFLFFASDRKGGLGEYDIWYAPLKEDGTTGQPLNAGPMINSGANEQSPFYHFRSASLVFASDKKGGMGGFDLFQSKRYDGGWTTAMNMGHPLNSSRDDVYFHVRQDGNLLDKAIVSSDRGSECCLGTYTVTKAPKRKIISGLVQNCVENLPMGEAEVVLKNEAGETISTITAADGTYSFELKEDISRYQLVVNKERYEERSAALLVNKPVNEAGWLEDTLYNEVLCMEKKPVIIVENVVSVYFEFDRSLLTTRGIEQLDSIYMVMEADPFTMIQISGYTDGLGSVEYNEILSDRRAQACADYLMKKGIDELRITFESFGACCPVEMEEINGRDNPDGRAMNRRALIHMVKEQ